MSMLVMGNAGFALLPREKTYEIFGRKVSASDIITAATIIGAIGVLLSAIAAFIQAKRPPRTYLLSEQASKELTQRIERIGEKIDEQSRTLKEQSRTLREIKRLLE